VRVGGDDERARNHVSALDHDLVADAGTGRVEIDTMLFGEGLDGTIFFLIRFIPVLDVVVKREDELLCVLNLLCADPLELAHDGRGIVVSHDSVRADGNKVSRTQRPRRTFG
jgi:hypothetical protein